MRKPEQLGVVEPVPPGRGHAVGGFSFQPVRWSSAPPGASLFGEAEVVAPAPRERSSEVVGAPSSHAEAAHAKRGCRCVSPRPNETPGAHGAFGDERSPKPRNCGAQPSSLFSFSSGGLVWSRRWKPRLPHSPFGRIACICRRLWRGWNDATTAPPCKSNTRHWRV